MHVNRQGRTRQGLPQARRHRALQMHRDRVLTLILHARAIAPVAQPGFIFQTEKVA